MKDWLIIDGYNLLYQISPELQRNDIPRLSSGRIAVAKLHGELGNVSAKSGRKDILQRLEPLLNVIARRITVVFDGNSGENDGNYGGDRVVEIIYSSSDGSADSVIENLVWNAGHPEDILVITSDRLIRDAVSARGADTMASSLFISMLAEQSANLADKIRKINKNDEKITLGDYFPDRKTN